MPENIGIFRAEDEADIARLVSQVRDAYAHAATVETVVPDEVEDDTPAFAANDRIDLSAPPGLVGVDPAVYRQIEAALKAGKRHIMLYGPPGTGKTEIARHLAGVLNPKWRLITGSADWTSQDIIGGYQPIGEGQIAFMPGVLLREFDRPLIIDELNRCDIDKVIGPLFTVLSGQASTLPYRVDVSDKDSAQYVILPQPKPGAAAHEFAPTPAWRIIATINSIDKASLYQMSYALTRRFGWIYVDAPADLPRFLIDYLRQGGLLRSETIESEPPLIAIWRAINAVRTIGAAPVIDVILTARELDPAIDFLLPATEIAQSAYLDGFYMFLLPMLDGILRQDAEKIASECSAALNLDAEATATRDLRARLASMAV